MPTHEKRLLNVLYSNLAYTWQYDTFLCSCIIFIDKILDIQNYTLSLVLNHVNNLQIDYMIVQYPIIGVFRIIYHFNSDLYLDLSQQVGF